MMDRRRFLMDSLAGVQGPRPCDLPIDLGPGVSGDRIDDQRGLRP